jgi:hypothetical protein
MYNVWRRIWLNLILELEERRGFINICISLILVNYENNMSRRDKHSKGGRWGLTSTAVKNKQRDPKLWI